MSWVGVPPEAAHFFLGKVTALGVLCCFALFVCLTLLASFFLPCHLSFSIYNNYNYTVNALLCYTHTLNLTCVGGGCRCIITGSWHHPSRYSHRACYIYQSQKN